MARITLGLVIALLAILQLGARAQAEPAHAQNSTAAARICGAADHLPPPERSLDAAYSAAIAQSTPDASGAQAAWRDITHGGAARLAFAELVAADARASRLCRLVPEAPNLSIVLLNLRQ